MYVRMRVHTYIRHCIQSWWVLQFRSEDFIGQHVRHGLLPQNVDVLEGYAGVAYRRGFLELEMLADMRSIPEARYADDVWIAGHLARRFVVTVYYYLF
jgi:hypothetical protein